MRNKKLFAEYMTMLGEIYDKEVTKTVIKAYWVCLNPYTDEEVEEAFKEVMTTLKFFPKPVELISIIRRRYSNALNAWKEVMVGLESGEKPKDPKTLEVVRRLGGWDYLGRCTYDELHWKEKQFKENYEDIKDGDIIMLPGGEYLESLNKITGAIGNPKDVEAIKREVEEEYGTS